LNQEDFGRKGLLGGREMSNPLVLEYSTRPIFSTHMRDFRNNLLLAAKREILMGHNEFDGIRIETRFS